MKRRGIPYWMTVLFCVLSIIFYLGGDGPFFVASFISALVWRFTWKGISEMKDSIKEISRRKALLQAELAEKISQFEEWSGLRVEDVRYSAPAKVSTHNYLTGRLEEIDPESRRGFFDIVLERIL